MRRDNEKILPKNIHVFLTLSCNLFKFIYNHIQIRVCNIGKLAEKRMHVIPIFRNRGHNGMCEIKIFNVFTNGKI
jgi:hypothetical protein